MFPRLLLIIAVTTLAVPLSGAMNLLLVGPGRIIMGEDEYTPTRFDADGDGLPEICSQLGTYPGPYTLQVRKLDGSMPWSYELHREDVCPTCDPATWEWWLVSFGDVDPEPLQEAVLRWYDYNTDQTGACVVNVSSSMIIATFPDAVCEVVLDLDGDGHEEVVMEGPMGKVFVHWIQDLVDSNLDYLQGLDNMGNMTNTPGT